MREIRIGESEAGQRLDKFLFRCLPGAGKSFLYKMMRKKNIVLNGKKASGSELLQEDDVLRIFFSDETLNKFSKAALEEPSGSAGQSGTEKSFAPDRKLIVYEDSQMVAVCKPAGMLSQKAGASDISLNEYLSACLRREASSLEEAGRFRPGVCNRLDRNTSGLVLAGKTPAAARELSAMLKERTLEKYYLCLVRGSVPESGRLSGYLEKDPASNRSEISDSPGEGRSYVETAWEPLRQYGSSTLLKVELVTGRSHQIRCHLAHIGHPLAGDAKYGDSRWNRVLKKRFGLTRQFLHAWQIVFPETGGILREVSGKTITAPLPEDLEDILKQLQQQEISDE